MLSYALVETVKNDKKLSWYT